MSGSHIVHRYGTHNINNKHSTYTMYKAHKKTTRDSMLFQSKNKIQDNDISTITASLQSVTIGTSVSPQLVSRRPGIAKLIEQIADLLTTPPSLFVDLEGVNLSRHGTISILQIYASPLDRTYLVDVHVLKEKAFSHPATNGMTLRDILESSSIQKVFFDVRRDSDALFAHFGVRLAGVQDLQLMEVATRPYRRRFLKSLAKCIECDSSMTYREKLAFKHTKAKGKELFDPDRGGSYEVFNSRPLSKDIKDYCSQDVQFLPELWRQYDRKLTETWKRRVKEEVERRISESQSAAFNGNGPHMAQAPLAWVYL